MDESTEHKNSKDLQNDAEDTGASFGSEKMVEFQGTKIGDESEEEEELDEESEESDSETDSDSEMESEEDEKKGEEREMEKEVAHSEESQSKTDSYSAIESEENKKKGEKQEKEKEEARSELQKEGEVSHSDSEMESEEDEKKGEEREKELTRKGPNHNKKRTCKKKGKGKFSHRKGAGRPKRPDGGQELITYDEIATGRAWTRLRDWVTNIKRERGPATKLIKLDEKKRQAVDLTTRKLKNAIDFGWKEGIAAAVVYCLPESRGGYKIYGHAPLACFMKKAMNKLQSDVHKNGAKMQDIFEACPAVQPLGLTSHTCTTNKLDNYSQDDLAEYIACNLKLYQETKTPVYHRGRASEMAQELKPNWWVDNLVYSADFKKGSRKKLLAVVERINQTYKNQFVWMERRYRKVIARMKNKTNQNKSLEFRVPRKRDANGKEIATSDEEMSDLENVSIPDETGPGLEKGADRDHDNGREDDSDDSDESDDEDENGDCENETEMDNNDMIANNCRGAEKLLHTTPNGTLIDYSDSPEKDMPYSAEFQKKIQKLDALEKVTEKLTLELKQPMQQQQGDLFSEFPGTMTGPTGAYNTYQGTPRTLSTGFMTPAPPQQGGMFQGGSGFMNAAPQQQGGMFQGGNGFMNLPHQDTRYGHFAANSMQDQLLGGSMYPSTDYIHTTPTGIPGPIAGMNFVTPAPNPGMTSAPKPGFSDDLQKSASDQNTAAPNSGMTSAPKPGFSGNLQNSASDQDTGLDRQSAKQTSKRKHVDTDTESIAPKKRKIDDNQSDKKLKNKKKARGNNTNMGRDGTPVRTRGVTKDQMRATRASVKGSKKSGKK